ncbi:SulP family inorganic anion transporter [Suttonella ornithocola]|nr:SulP family inorganic anion transporter [Suttonella ornithocola]
MRRWIGYVNAQSLQYDFWAGLTGAVMVLPQGIAFALIAGLPPEFGLYSAIVVQVIAGFFGSSLHMVTGPTVALSIVIPGIIDDYATIGSPQYIGLSLTLMMIVGAIQLCFGLFRLGSLVNFISHTVIIGFTAGAGLLIMVSQLPAFLGTSLPQGLSFLDKWPAIYERLSLTDPASVIIAAVTLFTALWIRRWNRRFPHMLIGMCVGALTAILLGSFAESVDTLGALPAHLPQVAFPELRFSMVSELFPSAFALALLGLIEAVSIARSIAIRSHQRIDSNQEFFGQGLANMVGSCFSCYVGSGSFNRSAVNYDAGARTPFALLFTSLIVIVVLVFIPWITKWLPMPAMAATIMLAGYNLFDFKHIKLIFKSSSSEFAIIVVTFLSTLFLNLEFAIYAGVILSLVLYLQKTSHPRITPVDFSQVTPVFEKDAEPSNLTVLRLDGSLFFGAVNHVQNRLAALGEGKGWQHVVLLAEGVNIIDVSGTEMLIAERRRLQKFGGDLYIIGLKPHVRDKLRKTPYWRPLGGPYHLYIETYIGFRAICKMIGIRNYREFMKHLFRDYNKI